MSCTREFLPLLAPALMLAALGAQVQPAHEPPQPREPVDEVIVVVGGQEFRESDLLAELNRQIPLVYYHKKVPAEQMGALRKRAFEKLVEKALIHQDAIARGIEATEEEVRAEMRKAVDASGDEYKGITEDQFERLLERFRPLVVKRLVMEKNEARFRESVPKPDAAALDEVYETILEKDPKALTSPKEAHLQQIFIPVDPSSDAETVQGKHERILAAQRMLKEGRKFEDVARTFSEDPSAKDGGDLGVVKQGHFKSRPLDEAAFSLAAGQVSDVIRSLYGFHILRCVEVLPQRRLTPDEVRPMLETWFASEHLKQRRAAWIAEMKKRFPVKILASEFRGGDDSKAAGEPIPGK
ncbi:MAG: hypothetical protein Fur0037_23490 [Planctomycetota bacterium]